MKYLQKPKIKFSTKASAKLLNYKPVFLELAAVHDDYIEGEKKYKDFPFWYGERPQIGFLSAAVWRCGGTILEEFKTERIAEREVASGRGDISIRYGNKGYFSCEGKRLRVNIGWSEKNMAEKLQQDLDKIIENLQEAECQVRKMHGEKGLAMCFVTPVIHKKKKGNLRNNFDSLWNALRPKKGDSTEKWSAALKIEAKHDQSIFCPHGEEFAGLILVIKEIR